MADLIIRGYNADDWAAVAAMCRAQPRELNPLQAPYMSDDYAQKQLKIESDVHGKFGLIAEQNGRVLGATLVQRYGKRQHHLGTVELFVVDAASQRTGIGSALLGALIDLTENWLNMSRLLHVVAVDNAAALALHRKHGFVIEGKMRDYGYRAGRYVDAYMLARTRVETP